jgi:hypothetical protein
MHDRTPLRRPTWTDATSTVAQACRNAAEDVVGTSVVRHALAVRFRLWRRASFEQWFFGADSIQPWCMMNISGLMSWAVDSDPVSTTHGFCAVDKLPLRPSLVFSEYNRVDAPLIPSSAV